MSKLISLVMIACSLFIITCTTDNIKNSLSRQKLKGSVKMMEEILYDPVERYGELQKDNVIIKTIHKYNKKGNQIEMRLYNPTGELLTIYTFKYNENGNEIEENAFLHGSKVMIKNKFDKIGNLIESDYYDTLSRIDHKNTYKNDALGNVIEFNWYNSKNELKQKNILIYDESGANIECNIYDSMGVFIQKQNYKYNKFDKEGNWISKTEFSFDKPFRIVERKIEYY